MLQFIKKSMLVPVPLDVTNIWDSCPKSGQKIWPEPDLARFAEKGRMRDLPEPKSGISLFLCFSKLHISKMKNYVLQNYAELCTGFRLLQVQLSVIFLPNSWSDLVDLAKLQCIRTIIMKLVLTYHLSDMIV